MYEEYIKQYRKDNKEKIKEYNRQWYLNNRKKVLEQSKQYYLNNLEKKREYQIKWRNNNPEKRKNYSNEAYKKKLCYIQNYKLSRGCAICGYNKFAAALDFHHLHDNKELTVGMAGCNSLKKIEKEINKCVVLCKNCHVEEHERLKKL